MKRYSFYKPRQDPNCLQCGKDSFRSHGQAQRSTENRRKDRIYALQIYHINHLKSRREKVPVALAMIPEREELELDASLLWISPPPVQEHRFLGLQGKSSNVFSSTVAWTSESTTLRHLNVIPTVFQCNTKKYFRMNSSLTNIGVVKVTHNHWETPVHFRLGCTPLIYSNDW